MFVKFWKRPATFKQTEHFDLFTEVMLSATPDPRAPAVNFWSLTRSIQVLAFANENSP